MAYRSIKVSHNNDLNMKTIEQKIKKARFEKKIFILLGSYYKVIRSSLLSRGWLEKIIDNQMPYALPGSERFIIASLLKHYPAQFIWQAKYRPIKRDENRPPFMNSIRRQRRFNFTSKDGLKNCFDAIGWNHEDGVVELSYNPRTHILDDKTTRDEFFEDFRNTAFTSFIYFLNTQEDLSELFSAAGTLTTDCIQYTVSKIELMIRIKEHVDIDMSKLFDTCAKYPQNQKIILHHIKQIIKGIKKFRFTSIENIERLKNEIKECAEKIEEQWPHLKYDGYSNIWILKPLHASQGNGIILEADDDKIRQLLANSSRTYLAQKYVERPLLIYNRKFDLRVYILTTILNRTVNIWLYRNCYIKFATKNFNLEDYHRSIHLTNYSVQKYFMKPENAVPKSVQGMWSLKQLKQYFESIGKNDMWDLKIYPGIKKSILAVMLPSLESTNIEHKTFELNGADVLVRAGFFKVTKSKNFLMINFRLHLTMNHQFLKSIPVQHCSCAEHKWK